MTNNNQYSLCHEHNNHPKEDLDFCKKCKLNNVCHVFQKYIQPPWVKDETKNNGMANSHIKVVRTSKLSAVCDKCRHYHGNLKCDAFPEKVPTAIKLGYVSHVHPYEGDQGIRFEPIEPSWKKRKGKKKRGADNR